VNTAMDVWKSKVNKEVITVAETVTVSEASELMCKMKVGALVVLDAKNTTILGLFTERDLINEVIAQKKSLDSPIGNYLRKEIIAADGETSIYQCLTLLSQHKFRHIILVDKNDQFGIISVGDIVKYISEKQQVEIKNLEGYIAGSYPA
jgi:signal-transduction protein with cAMP-binding, CBS, and nucleotidyltransferase domain